MRIFPVEFFHPFAEITFASANVKHGSKTIMTVPVCELELSNPAHHVACGRVEFKILTSFFERIDQLVQLLCHERVLCLKTPEEGHSSGCNSFVLGCVQIQAKIAA